MAPQRALLCALALPLLFACKPEEASVSDLLGDYVAEINAQVGILCDCFSELGYDSRSDCEADYGYIGPSLERCLVDALEQDKDASRDYFECVNALEAEYTACINERLDCGDFGSADVCAEDYGVGIDECIALPQAVERDLEQCYE